MKRAIILSLTILLATGLSAFAAGPTGSTVNEEIKKYIDKHMVYPVFQNQNMEGTVEVSFRINNDGKLNILNIKSSNPDLIDYVVKKLKKIQLDKADENTGQTIKYRFVFKKQA
jgi:outer membrane biosynthesis protein TonB